MTMRTGRPASASITRAVEAREEPERGRHRPERHVDERLRVRVRRRVRSRRGVVEAQDALGQRPARRLERRRGQREVGRLGELAAFRVGLEPGPRPQLVDHRGRGADHVVLGLRQPDAHPRVRDLARLGGDRAGELAALAQHHVRAPGVDRQLDPRQRRARPDAAEDLADHDVVRLLRAGDARCLPVRDEVVLERVGEAQVREPGLLDPRLGGDRRGEQHLVAGAPQREREREQRPEVAGAGRRGHQHAHPPTRRRMAAGYSTMRCSISEPCAISTSLTSSGPNRPWSTTPGVAESRAATEAGSGTSPK